MDNFAIDHIRNVHAWKIKTGFLVSFENTKTLQEFETKDGLINFLFLNGYKETARQFHKELED